MREYRIKEEDLNGLIAAVINNTCHHNHIIPITNQGPPEFKPNKNLGEGISAKENMDYRQELLDLLKTVYKDTQKIHKSSDSPENKISHIDKIIDNYIQDGKDLIEKSITAAYHDGVKYATKKLVQLGAKKPKIDKNPDRLKDLIRQQQMNHEDTALILRGRLRQLINIAENMGYYATSKA